jgi:hypothetical protein
MNLTSIAFNGSSSTVSYADSYDGDAAMTKEVITYASNPNNPLATYYLRSSVLGGAVIEEVDSAGLKKAGNVYSPRGELLATQINNVVTWKHNTAAGTGQYTVNTYDSLVGRTELDPLGADVAVNAPEEPPPAEGDGDIGANHIGGLLDSRWADFFNTSSGCTIDYKYAMCSEAMLYINTGLGEQCPDNVCVKPAVRKGKLIPNVFHVHADGYRGYELAGSEYRGAGRAVNAELDYVSVLDQSSMSRDERYSRMNQLVNAMISLGVYLKLGPSNDCIENVISKLEAKFKDFNRDEFAAFVFSVENRVEDGTWPGDGGGAAKTLYPYVTSQQAAEVMFPGSYYVYQAFEANPGMTALTSVTSFYFHVFVRPERVNTSENGFNADNKALLFHEALHGYGGTKGGTSYFDDDIQDALGIDVDPKNTKNITDYIKKHCF